MTNQISPQNMGKSPDNVQQKLQIIREDYTTKLPAKLKQIEALWGKIHYFNWHDDAFKLLTNHCHSLAGNGKLFGFNEMSTVAHHLTGILQEISERSHAPDEHKQKQISTLINNLIAVSKQPDDATQLEPVTPFADLKQLQHRATQLIYIVDDDPHIAQYLAEQLSSAGYLILMFNNLNSMYKTFDNEHPAVIILDTMFSEGSLAGTEAVENIRDMTNTRTPVIFISSRIDITARLSVLRAGGDAYFTKPINISGILSKLDELTTHVETNPYRVLIVDDDKSLAKHHALLLQQADIKTSVIYDPMNVIGEIMEFRPDLILIDFYMPKCDGLELAKVIRQDEKFLGIPIIFVSSETDPNTKSLVQNFTGDEFLTKPLDKEKLLLIVEQKAKNARRINNRIKEITKHDPATGLVNRKSFLSELETAIANNLGNKPKQHLLYLSLDQFDIHRKKLGFIHADKLMTMIAIRIQKNIRGNGIICQLAEGTFGILASRSAFKSILRIAENIRIEINSYPFIINDHKLDITCSIGVISINGSSRDVYQVVSQAEHASIKASEAGGDRANEYQQQISPGDIEVCSQAEIKKLLEKKRFKLVFQPIIDVTGSNDEHYEILLRLTDDNNKIILPAQFFPVAYSMNFASEIDRWVVENAIAILSDNPNEKVHTKFLIKINGESISKGSFLPWISNCVSDSRIKGEQRLIFEISETDAATKHKDIIKFINGAEKPLCGFALDRFGSTKYSLEIIAELPVDYVRIHSSLINDIDSDEESRDKIKTLIKCAQQLGKEVIISALEKPNILSILWDWNVRYFQGYFIKEPRESMGFNFGDTSLHLQ